MAWGVAGVEDDVFVAGGGVTLFSIYLVFQRYFKESSFLYFQS